jgi:endogenous inhibitor of DNA gyrase (YacG/DUF329 family)
MGQIVIKCPTTDKVVATGMGADKKSFEARDWYHNSFRCPACGKTHVWDKKDAWVQE